MTETLESPAQIEPCLLDETSMDILDLVASLSGAAHTLGTRLHPSGAPFLCSPPVSHAPPGLLLRTQRIPCIYPVGIWGAAC
jgi:hypothetical protein